MQKLRFFLIGVGFFWIFVWTTFGGILGVRINQATAKAGGASWLAGAQKILLVNAHAHMNLMAITTIVIGLSLSSICTRVEKRILKVTIIANVVSIPLFGLGLCLEAFCPLLNGKLPWYSAITAFGGIIYMITIAMWASFFMANFFKN